jgi:uncharacterized protein (DUF427 family)
MADRVEGAMTLTIGTGPFGDQGDKTFNFEVRAPRDHVLFFEDSPRRVRVVFGGETVADSRRVKLFHEQGHLPVYYFPRSDVRMDLLEATDLTTHCPFKGDASYWSVRVGDSLAENAVWGYPEPIDSAPPLADYLAFYWNKMDHLCRAHRKWYPASRIGASMSPKDKEPDPRDYRYLWFVTGRVKGLSDEEIAKTLHCGSVAHLYQRLSADGYPVCPACGAAPVLQTIAKNSRLGGSREKRGNRAHFLRFLLHRSYSENASKSCRTPSITCGAWWSRPKEGASWPRPYTTIRYSSPGTNSRRTSGE